MQSLLIQIEILCSSCAFDLKFLGITKAKRPNEAIFSKLNANALIAYYICGCLTEGRLYKSSKLSDNNFKFSDNF